MTGAVARLDRRRERLDRLLLVLPQVSLAGAFALVLVTGAARTPIGVTVALVAATAAWILWGVTLRPRPGRAAGFFWGLLGLAGALVWVAPMFGFFAWSLYLLTAYALPARWRVAGAAPVGVITAVSQASVFGQTAPATFAIVLGFNVTVACVMTHIVTRTQEQQAEHARMVDELAAAARENATLHERLVRQARETGRRDERQRMAGEIHDVLAQGLTGIVTQLEAAEAHPDRWRRHVDTARRLARQSLTEARRSVHALGPGSLDAADLPEALGELVEGWARLHGIRADLEVTGDARRLLPEIETALLRVAQESLTNVARHARAGRVGLSLSYLEDVVTLDVRDDGTGFDPARPPAGSFGLTGMRERVIRIAGTLEVESEPGDGTAISACVPALTAVPT